MLKARRKLDGVKLYQMLRSNHLANESVHVKVVVYFAAVIRAVGSVITLTTAAKETNAGKCSNEIPAPSRDFPVHPY